MVAVPVTAHLAAVDLAPSTEADYTREIWQCWIHAMAESAAVVEVGRCRMVMTIINAF